MRKQYSERIGDGNDTPHNIQMRKVQLQADKP